MIPFQEMYSQLEEELKGVNIELVFLQLEVAKRRKKYSNIVSRDVSAMHHMIPPAFKQVFDYLSQSSSRDHILQREVRLRLENL
jgi:hypothetical protein